ncbi:hypothetical protein JZU68_02600 [bacterium]|jgi:hypothetical protein|nr:hypothetical protein [bacterium]
MEENKTSLIRKIAMDLGSRGGTKTLQKYGSDHFRMLQKKGVEAKKRKKLE